MAPTRLPEVIVTATRTKEETFSLPYAVDAVDADEMGRKLPRTTTDALRELPSVMLQKTGNGQASPYLRGFTGFRTLMLVDGIRLNNSTFRDGPNQYWNTVDSLSLDRLEVVRGPGSVLHGSDAVGGTVNALSKGATLDGDEFDLDGHVQYRFSSAEDSHTGRVEADGGRAGRWGFHFGISPKHFGDLRGGAGIGKQLKTGYDELDWDMKLEYFVEPQSRLVYAHQTVRIDDAWRTHSTIYGDSWRGTTVGSDLARIFDQGRDLDYVQYHSEGLHGPVEEVHLSVSYHRQEEEEDRVRSSGIRDLQSVDVRTLGVSAQLESPSPVGRLIYGAEYYRDWVDSSFRRYRPGSRGAEVRAQGPVADDATYDLFGAYLEDQVPLFKERLRLILGGRYTHAEVDAGQVSDPSTGETFSIAESWNNVVGSARLLYRLDEGERGALYAGVSQGFRAPNLSDLTRWDADWGQEVPSPGVSPEKFLSLEAGARARIGWLAAEASYFHTYIDDMILRVPTGAMSMNIPVVTKENAGEGYIHGVEASVDAALSRDWTLWGNFTWMEGEVESRALTGGSGRAEPISRLMPVTFNAGLRWRHPAWHVWAEFATSLAGKQDRLSANDKLDTQRIPPGGTPAYGVYHLRAGWDPCTHTSLSVALENLTDEDYRIHGSGIGEPGRSVVVGAQFRF